MLVWLHQYLYLFNRQKSMKIGVRTFPRVWREHMTNARVDNSRESSGAFKRGVAPRYSASSLAVNLSEFSLLYSQSDIFQKEFTKGAGRKSSRKCPDQDFSHEKFRKMPRLQCLGSSRSTKVTLR